MQFQHSAAVWRDFPQLVAGVLYVEGMSAEVSVAAYVEEFGSAAAARLAGASESEFPEVQAWRRAFSSMGLKPTQYRSAAESLLRRYRKEGALPSLHPLVDLCNAASIAFAIPVAALDVSRISGNLEVRRSRGDERYLTFSGEIENPAVGEVIFADAAGAAHSRRWTNRQSGASAVSDTTSSSLIVTEALHESAARDVPTLVAALADAIRAVWSVPVETAVLREPGSAFRIADSYDAGSRR